MPRNFQESLKIKIVGIRTKNIRANEKTCKFIRPQNIYSIYSMMFGFSRPETKEIFRLHEKNFVYANFTTSSVFITFVPKFQWEHISQRLWIFRPVSFHFASLHDPFIVFDWLLILNSYNFSSLVWKLPHHFN